SVRSSVSRRKLPNSYKYLIGRDIGAERTFSEIFQNDFRPFSKRFPAFFRTQQSLRRYCPLRIRAVKVIANKETVERRIDFMTRRESEQRNKEQSEKAKGNHHHLPGLIYGQTALNRNLIALRDLIAKHQSRIHKGTS